MIASTMAAAFIENRTYDEIQVGDTATLVRTLRPEDIQLFAVMSGDVNPAHVDPEYAHSSMFQEVIAHGMWGGALISTVLGTEFPGPGTIYISQTLRFSRPVKVGDTITIKITCKHKFDHNKHITFDCLCTNQEGLKVISGEAEVLAPMEKIKRERVELPEVMISDRWGSLPEAHRARQGPLARERGFRAPAPGRVAAKRRGGARLRHPAADPGRAGKGNALTRPAERDRSQALPAGRCAALARRAGACDRDGGVRAMPRSWSRESSPPRNSSCRSSRRAACAPSGACRTYSTSTCRATRARSSSAT